MYLLTDMLNRLGAWQTDAQTQTQAHSHTDTREKPDRLMPPVPNMWRRHNHNAAALKHNKVSWRHMRKTVILTKLCILIILTFDIDNVVLQLLLLIKTTITSAVDGLNVQYYQTVIASRGVVNAETMTNVLKDLTINIDVPDKWCCRCLSVKPRDVGSGGWCHVTRQLDIATFVHSNGTRLIRNSWSHTHHIPVNIIEPSSLQLLHIYET